MSTQAILAEETVSITEFRKKPQNYFTDHPIAILSNNRAAGYVIGAQAYEELLSVLRQSRQTETFEGRFRPTAARLKELAQRGAEQLAAREDGDPAEFTEA